MIEPSSARFATAIHRHRRSLLLLAALAILGGCLAVMRLPMSLFPEVHFPRVVVGLSAGDRSAERMAIEISAPVEEALRALPGVTTVRSLTTRGEAEVSVSFGWDQDMDLATLRTQGAVTLLTGSLPPGTQLTVRRMDPTIFPSVALSLTSPTRSVADLRRLAWDVLRPQLATVPGVAKIDVQGGAVDETHLVLDEAALRAHGVTPDQVIDAVTKATTLAVLGRIEDHGHLQLVLIGGQVGSADDLRALPVRGGTSPILLGAVAEVRPGVEPTWTRVAADGRDAVAMQLYQQPGANGVGVSAAIAQAVRGLKAQLPGDVVVETWYDHADLISASALSVRDSVVIGTVLAAVVLLIFLRDWRVTLVALVAVPASLGTTALVLAGLHRGLDLMSLGGMAAAVGLIIDDAIVMVEHVVTSTARTAAGQRVTPTMITAAAVEFAPALAGSSAATLAVFVPLIFLPGLTGAFFTALALTMTVGLVASFLVSLLVIPALAAACGIGGHGKHPAAQARPGWYIRSLSWLLVRPWLVLLLILPLAGTGWRAFSGLGSGFMPSMDEGGFILDYRAPPGTALSETDRLVRQIEVELRATPEVRTYARRTGLQLGGGVTETNEGDIFIRLRHDRSRGCEAIMDDVRERVTKAVPGLDVEMAQLMEDLIGDLVANPHPIEVILSADDPAAIAAAATRVADAVGRIPDVVDVNDGQLFAGDALHVAVDPVAAAREGLDGEMIGRQVGTALSGLIAGGIIRGNHIENLRVWVPAAMRTDPQLLAELPLRAPDGHIVPLSRVAHLVAEAGQPQIVHQDLRRAVAVTGRISGRDLGSVVADVQQALQKPGIIPAGVTWRLGGLYAQQQQAFHDLAMVLGAGTLLVFLLVVFLYERLRVALAILTTTALALTGVAFALRLTGIELNLASLMGLTMVVGIATEVGVLLVSAWSARNAETDPIARLTAAASERVRPILMTVIAAVLALLPLAAGWGEGSELLRPLAIAIIGGLLVQLPLALVVLPLLLRLLRCR